MRLTIVTVGLIATTFAQIDLISLLEQTPDLSTLLKVINSVPNLLNVSQDITILAPTNAAFEALSPESFSGQFVAEEAYDALLSYHVLVGLYPSTAAGEVPIFPRTLLNKFEYYLDNGPAAKVTPSNHVGFFTNGEEVQVLSGALGISTVTEADIRVGGKIIHKIDTVLQMPQKSSTTAGEFGLTAVTGALASAGLVKTVDETKDVTLFIPTNEAFQAAGSVLQGADQETLQSVLAYHVVNGSVVYSSDVTNSVVPSYGGQDLTLSVVDGTIFVNTAKVVIPNIITFNGVAHVIDVVLNPMETSVNRGDLDPSASPSPAFAGASSASVVPFASSAPPASATLSVPPVATTLSAVGGETTAGGMSGAASSSSAAPSVSVATGAAMPQASMDRAVLFAGALLGGALAM